MTQLSDSQIVAKARAAGFAGAGLVQAVAHVLAESGGNSDAVSSTNDWGWFQWNARWHPEGVAVRGTDQEFALAYQVSDGGTNWSQWSTTTNGGVAKVLARATAAVNGTSGTSGGDVTATPALSVGGFHIPLTGDAGGNIGPDIPGAITSGIGTLVKGVLMIAIKGVLVLCGVALVVLGVAALARKS